MERLARTRRARRQMGALKEIQQEMLLDGQASITPSAPLWRWQISRNLLGRADCFLLKRALFLLRGVALQREYCVNGGERRRS